MAASGGIRKLRELHVGQEGTPGTAVTGTARLIGDVTVRDNSQKETPDRDHGLLDSIVEPGVIVATGGEVDYSSELSFEALLYALESGIKSVTPNEETMGEGDYKWTYSPLPSAAPTLKTLTFDYEENDGSGVISTLEMPYGICDQFSIRAAQGANFAEMSAHWNTQGPSEAADLGVVALPVWTPVPAQKFKLGHATSFSGLSSATFLSGLLVDFEWSVETGIMPKWRLDASLDAESHRVARRSSSLRLTVDLSSFSESERATYFRTSALHYFRVEVEGAVIGSGDPHRIQLDFTGQLIGPHEEGSTDEDQSVVTLEYEAVYDPTATKAWQLEITNTLATLP